MWGVILDVQCQKQKYGIHLQLELILGQSCQQQQQRKDPKNRLKQTKKYYPHFNIYKLTIGIIFQVKLFHVLLPCNLCLHLKEAVKTTGLDLCFRS